MSHKPVSNSVERAPTLHVVALVVFLVCSVASELVLGVHSGAQSVELFSRAAILFLALFVLHLFSLRSLQGYRSETRDLVLFFGVFVGCLLLTWLGRLLGLSVVSYLESSAQLPGLSTKAFSFAVPYAVGAALLQAVLGLHYGLFFATCFALCLGLYFPDEPLLPTFVLTSSLVSCLSLSRCRSRSSFVKAGVNVSIISIPFALASMLGEQDVSSSEVLVRLLGAVLGGFLVSSALWVTPIIEYLGGYVTDMRLLEIATLDHPLLKELSIQAPGTWNHSTVMGMMVEAAADAVGANPVLARVGAYFHDVGKVKKPLYFVENQLWGENRHDKLSTSMSALIIRSHVKDGLELARKYNLPQSIQDMISQHHGTSLIEYFYDKACKEAQEAGQDPNEVDKSLYTYPGPKPQTREAGILMLADGIEAAARTLSDPNHDRIQGMVQKLMNKVFASGQLNECELTLKDLHVIAKCFTRVLTGIYHQRIAYAEPADKGHERTQNKDKDPQRDEKKEGNGAGPTKNGRQNGDGRAPREENVEDLKRLGL
jgi:cyclic-di-AMP phosphodiesterase PgpH